MVQELIPKEKIKASPLISFLFRLSLVLLIILGLCYFGLKMKISSLKSQIEETKVKIDKIKAEEDRETERQVLNYERKIEDFSKLFSKHKITSHFFDFLRESTHPKVRFSELTLDLDTETANLFLMGETENFKTLGEQVLCFQRNKFVKGLDLSNLSLRKEGGVNFNINLSLDPKIFKNE